MSEPMCLQCGAFPAQVCDECRRACALKSFSAISRHPESTEPDDVACLVCEDGPAAWCGGCWATAVAEYRRSLRTDSGHDIGRWPDYPAMRLATGSVRREVSDNAGWDFSGVMHLVEDPDADAD